MKKNPWTGARGRLWRERGRWLMEVRDARGRVVWRDWTGYRRQMQAEHLEVVARVVGAVRMMEGIGHKLQTANRIGLWK